MNFISTDLSAQMISTQNDGQKQLWIQILWDKAIYSNTNTGEVDCVSEYSYKYLAIIVFLAFIWWKVLRCIDS